MNFRGILRQNSHDSCLREGSLRWKGSPWQRRSLNSENSKHLKNVVDTVGTLPRGRKQAAYSRSNSLVDYADPQRTVIMLEKQDNEAFGFEVQTYGLQRKNSGMVEMCTFVYKVQENSPAETAGLTPGDIIVTVNGVSMEGCSHQHIVDQIQNSANFLTMETMSGNLLKRIELERKLQMLKESQQEKWAELRAITLQEQRLVRDKLNDSPPLPCPDSPMSLASPVGWGSQRFSSDSSCRSILTEDSEDSSPLPCVFEDWNPFSPVAPGDERFFPGDLALGASWPSLAHAHSVNLSDSRGSLSPSWDARGTSSPRRALPQKARRGSVRRKFMKFIPGLNRSVEEDEDDH
ncbi:cytohesin-interacting protein-like [Megalops cyprinoides]|uniref:cytohesin-interacting protein-like n=1 Tax=Megalops cyprinoides TaxID=118141 RepID=UPI001863E769|nr:cytohesin-interacting protein-like [Megalops cyprinoides]